MLKLLFKVISWPTWELSCIYVQSHAYVKGDISGNPGSKKNPKEHLCSQACAPIPIHKKLWSKEFSWVLMPDFTPREMFLA